MFSSRSHNREIGIMVVMSDVISGRRPSGNRRAPKAVDDRRVCADRGCKTVLSKYNRKATCHVHSPIKFPRVRGRNAPQPG